MCRLATCCVKMRLSIIAINNPPMTFREAHQLLSSYATPEFIWEMPAKIILVRPAILKSRLTTR